MLLEIDRVQLAVPDPLPVIEKWQSLLGAEMAGTDSIPCLGAKRTSLRLGTGVVEILQPDGTGLVDDAVSARGAHLFAAGASCTDLSEVQRSLESRSGNIATDGRQLFVTGSEIGIEGLGMVISQHEERESIGDIDFFYEATLLATDAEKETAAFSGIFSLDPDHFVPISSPHFGYTGILTLFQRDRLHRFEIITPSDPGNTMGRFFSKFGPSLYMAYAETSRLLDIERRVRERGEAITVDRPEGRSEDTTPEGMWLHPPSLGGMMLGLSRPTKAWQWSGHPEWVEAL